MGGHTYSYDCNGNMITRAISGSGTYNLTYDGENRLVSMTGTSLNANFVYNGDGERVKGTVNGVTTTYVGNYYEMTGTANTKYYYANSVRTAEKRTGYTDQNGVYWLLADPDLAQQDSGSTTITAYTAGGKKAELRYAPMGCQPSGWTRYSSGNTLTSLR